MIVTIELYRPLHSKSVAYIFISQLQQMVNSVQTKKTNVYSLRFYLSPRISIGQSQVL